MTSYISSPHALTSSHVSQKENSSLSSAYLTSTKRSLRYILTQICNYRCSFCHQEGCEGNEPELLSPEDYVFLYNEAKQLFPIDEVTLSGGEPLMYKNIDSLISYLHTHQLPLTLITNGSLLHRHLHLLPYLKKLIISLHTTQQALYQNLTQTSIPVSSLIQTITNIKDKHPHLPIVINSTLLKEYVTQQTPIRDLLQFIKDHGLILKILELSPHTHTNYIVHDACIPFLEELGFVEDIPKDPQDYKNKKTYRFNQAKVILRKCACDLVNYYHLSNTYCKHHNDIVISPNGYIGFCTKKIKQIPLYDTITHRDSIGFRNALSDLLQTPSSCNG